MQMEHEKCLEMIFYLIAQIEPILLNTDWCHVRVAVHHNYPFATWRGERHHSLRFAYHLRILIPSMDRPARSGAQPGAWEWRPPRGLAKNARVSVMVGGVEVEFHCCILFESVCDKNFTNQSAHFSFFPFPLWGKFLSDGLTTCAFRSDRRRRHPSSPFAHGLTRCWRCRSARSSL